MAEDKDNKPTGADGATTAKSAQDARKDGKKTQTAGTPPPAAEATAQKTDDNAKPAAPAKGTAADKTTEAAPSSQSAKSGATTKTSGSDKPAQPTSAPQASAAEPAKGTPAAGGTAAKASADSAKKGPTERPKGETTAAAAPIGDTDTTAQAAEPAKGMAAKSDDAPKPSAGSAKTTGTADSPSSAAPTAAAGAPAPEGRAKELLLRALLTALAVLLTYIAWLGATAIAILQFILTALRGSPLDDLKKAGRWLRGYGNRLYRYLSFEAEHFPLPGEDEY
ncbi:uncharacterized protein DUF4389 [Rhodothalassium salexigens DSM 2132]|uniref:Uncharacterized protein DUF4389 n=1 Tax=Rhodothalassium salexigens DSM 2132 TaxID=1188247 RepID=A0A4R2PQ48_RHOSA|nr:DUF4389 domain-containing protein [Rhodothalassium salexigens]MBB4210524.1 hypothetical protein [Rhodothalassium salexigens DSM 2132]MBK1638065.1 hypothetical protein [Rhodothalassium salexigens DSM 2132]TCP37919.1 uncharacterized protein DUF4389 [Rhodothalassium salexigens DSM 2132]